MHLSPGVPGLPAETPQLEAVSSTCVPFEGKHAFKRCANFKGLLGRKGKCVLSHNGTDRSGLGAVTTLGADTSGFLFSFGVEGDISHLDAPSQNTVHSLCSNHYTMHRQLKTN